MMQRSAGALAAAFTLLALSAGVVPGAVPPAVSGANSGANTGASPGASPGARGGEARAADLKAAVARSIPLLQSSPAIYINERDCFSCHHQTLPVMAATAASRFGIRIDAQAVRKQSEHTLSFFASRRAKVSQGQSVPGGAFTAGYALVGLAADQRPHDDTTDALVSFLLKDQRDDGHWRIRTHRPPVEDSDFTATALSLRGLQLFASPQQRDDVDKRIAKARQWLLNTRPRDGDHEDRMFRLFGLKWSGADNESIAAAVADLLAMQRDDGGWAQLPDRASDAYATGSAMVALHEAGGLPVTHEAYQRGLAFLLRTQRDDGSWQVTTRSRPIQKYFESGFPYGKDQFISICGTSWATMAICDAIGEAPKTP